MPWSKESVFIWTGAGAAGGSAGGSVMADGMEPISSPLASGSPVTNGFEIGSGIFVAWFVVSDAERLPLKEPVVVCTVPRLTVSRLPLSCTLAVMLM